MIKIIPNVLSIESANVLIQELNPKHNGNEDFYFVSDNIKTGLKKLKCSDHPIVKDIISKFNLVNVESVSILYYPVGSSNLPHSDNSIVENNIVTKVRNWKQTAIVFLNNDFVGGELVYPDQGCVFYPTIGNMIIASADAEYIHYVTPITSGDRYTLVFRLN
jgi:hypothetical protein